MKSMKGYADAAETIKPAAHTATVSGDAVDLQGYESCMVVINLGDWTDGTHAFAVQESDTTTSGDFADVADADLEGSEFTMDAANEDDAVKRIGYHGSKRYLRVKATVSGATTGAVYSALIVRGDPHYAPID